jgi:signal transduction histidine kinase
MRNGRLQWFGQWFAERAELVVLGLTLLTTASLVVWWTILLRGQMHNNELLEREALAAQVGLSAEQRVQREAEIAAHHDRRNVMLAGESTLLALLLSGSLVVLFLLAQRRKQQREDMEKLLQFTSHEFKTPVAGVKGLLQSLAMGSIPDAQRAELIHLGQLECDRLEHLAETILAYQRAMSREPREGAQPIDVARFIADLLAHRARTAGGADVQVALIDAVQVLADRDGLRVILENLLDNANKYGGGSVRLAAGVVDGHWRLDISDQGRGFAPAVAEKLFDVHNRGSGEGVTHGAGLGLAIARQLARRMGGDITASSPGPGKGAVFSVTLLLAPPSSMPVSQQGSAHG